MVDANGRMDTTFTIPEDYGGCSRSYRDTLDGTAVAQNGVEVTQNFEMTPLSGPVGTPIELRVKGLALANP